MINKTYREVRRGAEMKINKMLEIERKKRGMTQQEFSEYIGIPRGTLSHHELGRNISLRYLKRYSEKLNINLLDKYIKAKLGGIENE